MNSRLEYSNFLMYGIRKENISKTPVSISIWTNYMKILLFSDFIFRLSKRHL